MAATIISQSKGKAIIQIEVKFSNSMLESEKSIQKSLNEAGCKATELLLEAFDTTGTSIVKDNILLTSKGKVKASYQTPYGEVIVGRHIYQTSKGGKTFCPLDQNVRLFISATPLFAKQLSSKYADFGAKKVITDLYENHGRKITHTFVQDAADRIAAVALARDEEWAYLTPKPTKTVATIAIGVDGSTVLSLTDGWMQALIGTIALYAADGERIHTTYIGATPEYGKDTFLGRMEREISHVKNLFPNAEVLGFTDGDIDSWTFLSKHTEHQLLDFFHATDYLTNVGLAAFKNKNKRTAWLNDACHKLKHKRTGINILLREMQRFRFRHIGKNNRTLIVKTMLFFQSNKNIMNYVKHLKENKEIGSGVIETDCKQLVVQRLCTAGTRWKERGAFTVLSLKALSYSTGRWEQFWQKIDNNGSGLSVLVEYKEK